MYAICMKTVSPSKRNSIFAILLKPSFAPWSIHKQNKQMKMYKLLQSIDNTLLIQNVSHSMFGLSISLSEAALFLGLPDFTPLHSVLEGT